MFQEYPVLETVANIVQAFKRITVDGEAIIIDHANHQTNAEDSHIILRGNLEEHEAFIKIKNASGTELFRINHAGKVLAPMDVVAPSITAALNASVTNTSSISTLLTQVSTLSTTHTSDMSTLETALIDEDLNLDNKIIALQLIINNALQATSIATDGTLVLRNNSLATGGTHFTAVTMNTLITNYCLMYGNANLQWVPLDNNSQPVAGAIVRVGRNDEEAGSSVGDGVEIRGLPMLDGSIRNKLLLTANESAPTIEMTCNKSNTAPYLRCRDLNEISQIEISRDGFLQKMYHQHPTFDDVSQGASFGAVLGDTILRYTIILDTDWTDSSQTITMNFQRSSAVDDELNNFLTCECCIDQSDVEAVYLDSAVYIDRVTKNIKKNQHSLIRVVLKCEFLNNETDIPQGTKILVTVNNQKMLS